MAFELPTLPFPKDATGVPYIASPDENGKYTVASGQWFKNASNLWVPVSATDPLPIKIQTELPAGAQVIGQVKLTDGTDALLVNANGSINIVPVNSAGTELFTDANPGSMKLTGRRIALPAPGNYDQTLDVSPGGTATITVTPPAGEIWRIWMVTITIPAIAGSTGTHRFRLRVGINNDYGNLLSLSADYSSSLSYTYRILGTGTAVPPDTAEQQRAVIGLPVSSNCPLYLFYNNDSDASQTGSCVLQIIREVEYIVS